jgi:hypothetical protein
MREKSPGILKIELFLCLTKHHAMKTYWGGGDIAPRILSHGTRWRRRIVKSRRL